MIDWNENSERQCVILLRFKLNANHWIQSAWICSRFVTNCLFHISLFVVHVRFAFGVVVAWFIYLIWNIFSSLAYIPSSKCIQLTPDVKHLYGKGRKLHAMDAVWPQPKACIIDRPPPFVSRCFLRSKRFFFFYLSLSPLLVCIVAFVLLIEMRQSAD